MISYNEIKEVHLEISSRCNAACPECPRNLRGADIEDLNAYEVRDMTLEEVQKIFPIDFLQQLRIININGNFGDFITCRDGLKIVEYFSSANKDLVIQISTNASGRPAIWSKLGSIPNVIVIFRIDGLEDTHHLYRRNTDFKLILKNASNFIAAGGKAKWWMIKFDFNEHQFDEAKQMSEELGFIEFQLIDHGRNNTPVYSRNGIYQYSIGNPPPATMDFPTLLEHYKVDKLPNMVNFYKTLDDVPRNINCMAKIKKEIYVQSNGQVYPCCWIGKYPDTNWNSPGTDQTRLIAKHNNALEVGIESAINWFKELEKTWTLGKVSKGQHFSCNKFCGKEKFINGNPFHWKI